MTEAKNAVAKLIIANSGMPSNREIREESEIVGNLQRNYEKQETNRYKQLDRQTQCAVLWNMYCLVCSVKIVVVDFRLLWLFY
jgi:hypothetical protein